MCNYRWQCLANLQAIWNANEKPKLLNSSMGLTITINDPLIIIKKYKLSFFSVFIVCAMIPKSVVNELMQDNFVYSAIRDICVKKSLMTWLSVFQICIKIMLSSCWMFLRVGQLGSCKTNTALLGMCKCTICILNCVSEYSTTKERMH